MSQNKPNSGSGPFRIFIVDDHPIVRQGLCAMINQEADLEICGEADGYHQALERIPESKPDLAIIDLTLEDIGGLELIKQVHARHPEVPVLVLSMHDEILYAERALRAGSRGYIMKQRGSDKLIVAIRTVLRGELYVSETMSSRMLGKYLGQSNTPDSSPVSRLSDRELEIFQLLGNGLGTRDIAGRLSISIKTVESHRENIKTKLRLRNASELVHHATQWALKNEQS